MSQKSTRFHVHQIQRAVPIFVWYKITKMMQQFTSTEVSKAAALVGCGTVLLMIQSRWVRIIPSKLYEHNELAPQLDSLFFWIFEIRKRDKWDHRL